MLHAQTLVHQRGKTFSFPLPTRRVVTIAIPLFWEYLSVDGPATHGIGTNAVASSQFHDGIGPRVLPEAVSIPTDITRGGTVTPTSNRCSRYIPMRVR
jgi:hypothetical protein